MSSDTGSGHSNDEMLKMSIGSGIRRARLKLGLTQAQVADQIGITGEYYARLERGHALPSVVVLREIALALNVDAAELLGTRDSSVPPGGDEKISPPRIDRIIERLRNESPERVRLIRLLIKTIEERLRIKE